MGEHSTREQGLFAQALSVQHLQKQGLRLRTENYLTKIGEIDLIMEENDTLVFIEVRSRWDFDEIHPFETVTKPKQARIIRTAKHYLLTQELVDVCPCRFDVVAVNLQTQAIEWERNAFF